MEDLDRRLMAEKVVKRRQRQALGQRIDQHRLAFLAGQRHLDQAQLGIIGPLAQEFGVDGDIGLALAFAKGARASVVVIVCIVIPVRGVIPLRAVIGSSGLGWEAKARARIVAANAAGRPGSFTPGSDQR
jgi:hypothetical protein